MSILPGARLGSYEVIAPLGAGGMGEVFRAHDTKLGRDVAIKVLPATFAADPDRLLRFEREARTLAALNHPQIAHVYGVEESANVRALVMELVEGEDLAHRIARGSVALDEALQIGRQIADALEAAHDAGIVHRDLKPANVMLRADGSVKVLDFGLAKTVEARSGAQQTITSPAMTMGGVILGTAAYMAPEQAKGRAVDKRADIWAFGCVLYEMLTGRRPFDGEDVTDTIAAVVSKEPDWSHLPTSTPSSVSRLLARCLTKDPKQRLRDIGDAHPDLSADAPVQPVTTPTPSRAPTYVYVIAGAALVTGAALAFPTITHLREGPRAARPMRLTVDAPPNAARLLGPQLSPDGQTLVFSSIASGRTGPDLWIRRLDESTPRMISNAPQPSATAFWSPDGRALVYPAGGALVRPDVATSAVRQLTKINTTLLGISRFIATWSQEGVILFSVGDTIFRLPEGGGEPTPVKFDGLAAGSDNRFPVFLPDGRRFFFLSNEPGATPHIHLASIDGGAVSRLFAAESQAIYTEPEPGQGYVVFIRDTNLMAQRFDRERGNVTGEPIVVAASVPVNSEYGGNGRGPFSASRDGVLVYHSEPNATLQRLTWFDRTGQRVASVGEPAPYLSPRLSPDGRTIAVTRFDRISRPGDIYVLDDTGIGERLTFDPGNDLEAVWTPQGTHLIWGANRSGKFQLMRKRADGVGPEDILHESMYSVTPDDVSPDGRFVVFRENHPNTRNDLWVLPLDGSGPARPLLQTPADEPRGRFSPDGKLLGYISDGQPYLQTFPSMDGKWQVNPAGTGGLVPQWRRDGKELYYQTARTVYARSVLSTNPLRLGEPVELFAPPLTIRGSFFHVAPDGQRFLYAVSATEALSLQYHVALDWAPTQ